MPVPSEPVVSAALLIALAFCQPVSRTGQNCTPPPLPPAGCLVSALDTKTNRPCALAPYSTGGGGRKHPSYVNNREYLAAHLIFSNFISVKVGASRQLGGPSYPKPGSRYCLGEGRPMPQLALFQVGPQQHQLQTLMEAKMEFSSTVPRLSIASCPLPEAETGRSLDGVTASQ